MIPHFNIYLNSFNRLDSLRNMVNCLICDFENVNRIYIVDNQSQRPDLLDFLGKIKYHPSDMVEYIPLERNAGPRGAWNYAWNRETEYYVVSDCDLDISECPSDALRVMYKTLQKYQELIKVGLSLRIDDLPESEGIQSTLINEKSHWTKKVDDIGFEAPIDTTFHMCRPNVNFFYEPAIRLSPPYSARHLPWYIQPGNISEEEALYFSLLPTTHKKGLSWSTYVSDNKKLFGV